MANVYASHVPQIIPLQLNFPLPWAQWISELDVVGDAAGGFVTLDCLFKPANVKREWYITINRFFYETSEVTANQSVYITLDTGQWTDMQIKPLKLPLDGVAPNCFTPKEQQFRPILIGRPVTSGLGSIFSRHSTNTNLATYKHHISGFIYTSRPVVL